MGVDFLLQVGKWTPRRTERRPMPVAAQVINAKLCDINGHAFTH